jgi:hypothetical protein
MTAALIIVVYVLLATFTWAQLWDRELDECDKFFAVAFWPVVWAIYIYQMTRQFIRKHLP